MEIMSLVSAGMAIAFSLDPSLPTTVCEKGRTTSRVVLDEMVGVALHVSLINDTYTLPMNAKGEYLINEVESGPTVNNIRKTTFVWQCVEHLVGLAGV
jgi:hypothetical protein